MSVFRFIKIALALLVLFALSACSFSTAGDVTPPPGAEVVTRQTPLSSPTEPLAAMAQEATLPAEASAAPDEESSTGMPSGEQADAAETFSLSGRVANLSGGDVPAGLEVVLQVFQGMEIVDTRTTALSVDGDFTFDAVALAADQMVILTVEYEGVVFGSDVISAENLAGAGAAGLEIAIYDSTTDPSSLYADRTHIFLSLLAENRVQVVVYLLVSNPTDVVVVGDGAESPVLSFRLPLDAANLQFEETGMSARYIPVEGGFGDLMNIRPGLQQHEILYAYELPFDGEREIAFNFPVEVRSGMLVAPEGLQLDGSGLENTGEREMETGMVTLYSFAALAKDDTLEVALSSDTSAELPVSGGSTTGLAIGLGAFAVVLILAGLWLRRRPAALQTAASETEVLDDKPLSGEQQQATQQPPAKPVLSTQEAVLSTQEAMLSTQEAVLSTQEAVLDAIVELDQAYETGHIDRVPYLTRRAELKERLKKLREIMSDDKGYQ